MILGMDPGTTHSAIICLEQGKIEYATRVTNEEMLDLLRALLGPPSGDDMLAMLAIEMIASYGMPVGREVFETVLWVGRFLQVATDCDARVHLIYRREVKLHLYGSVRANDANIRQALIDRLGPPGTKKKPGATYGITGDLWSALAVAVTFAATRLTVTDILPTTGV